MHRILTGLLLVLILGTSAAFAAVGGQKWAVVIGIDHYDQEDIAPLQYAEADARTIVDSLKLGGNFDNDHIILLTSQGEGKLRASRANMIDCLVRLRDKMTADDTLVFFFAGHGVSLDKQAYLLTSDTIPVPVENLQGTALNLEMLRGLLEKLPVRRMLVAIDACRSDPRAARGMDDNPLQETFSRGLVLRQQSKKVAATATDALEVSATLFACRVGQRSYEWPEKHHGYFSYYLAAGLRGQAANDQGQVTLTSLITYIEAHVPQQVLQARGAASQTPWAEVQGTGASTWELAHVQPGNDADAPSLDNPMLARAQGAFAAKNFGEPPGENAIELSLAAQKQVANDPAAVAMEKRAVAAYEDEAKAALTAKNRARALAIYQRLYHIYPNSEAYLKEVNDLSLAEAPDITGVWEFSAWGSKERLTMFPDGRAISRDIAYSIIPAIKRTGNWTWDPQQKVFHINFPGGLAPTGGLATVSEDLRSLSFQNYTWHKVRALNPDDH